MFTPGGRDALPDLGHLLHHDPAERGADHGVLKLGLGEGEVGLRLGHLGLGDAHAARRGVTLVHGDDLLRGEVLRELQLPDVLGEVGIGPLYRSLRPIDGGLVVDRLEPGDHLALTHHAALLDAQVGEAALDLGGHHGLATSHHVARGGQDRRARARLDVAAHGGGDRLHLGRREGLLRAQRVETDQDDGHGEEQQERPAPGAPRLAAPVDLEGGELALQVRHSAVSLDDLRAGWPPRVVNIGERPACVGEPVPTG
jgi:hypothetical protein